MKSLKLCKKPNDSWEAYERKSQVKRITFMSCISLLVVLCIITAIVVPVEFATRLGEESELMWSEDMEFSIKYTDWKKDYAKDAKGEQTLHMSYNTPYAAATLRKDPNKDFVIVNFTDTQAYLPSDFSKTGMIYKTMKKVIDQTHPDLITFSGDQAWFPPTRQSYAKLAKIMDGFKIPWTYVFGNHDHEGNCDRNYLIEVTQKSKYCIIDKGPRNVMGVGNCFINIVERQPDSGRDKIVHTVILLDSGDSGYHYSEDQTYFDDDYITEDDIKEIEINAKSDIMKNALADCTMDFSKYPYLEEIDDVERTIDGEKQEVECVKVGKTYAALDYTQMDWYKWVLNGNKALNALNGFEDSMPESTCIFHIAFNEFYDAYKLWLRAIQNSDVAAIEAMQPEGRMRMGEIIGSGTYNTGMFDLMKNLGSTKNVIIGHDHVNDFSLVYEGIRLTYGVKTGSKCYWTKDGTMNGGTKLTIGADGNATSLKQIYIDDYAKKK